MAKTRQFNLRLDEKALGELQVLAEIMGETTSETVRTLIGRAYARLTPSMLAELAKKRANERSVRAKVFG